MKPDGASDFRRCAPRGNVRHNPIFSKNVGKIDRHNIGRDLRCGSEAGQLTGRSLKAGQF